ncbi:MAG: DNA-binding GntR family transcriptional regulator [Cellvibrionaceae bacterium]|jgi:DNA-binding GntR family transcriptional regulator
MIKKTNNKKIVVPMKTAVSHVYDTIKQGIIDNEYKPHQYVRESAVAKELDVSRTPVREALRELVSEGWLEAIPHYGARVVEWTERDALEVFEIRLILEPMAIAASVSRIDTDTLAHLIDLAEQMESLVDKVEGQGNARNEIAALNHEFHQELINACGNERLISLLQNLVRLSVIRRNFNQYNADNLNRSMRHHREVLDAIESKNAAWAEHVMTSHLLAARELHLNFLK